MDVVATNADRYSDGTYLETHTGWHAEDSEGKSADILPGILTAIRHCEHSFVRIAEVGAGTGSLLIELSKRLAVAAPNVTVRVTGYDISPQAIAVGRQRFPGLDLRLQAFEPKQGPFDVVILADVLEHLENPWQMLRDVRVASECVVVRQPLIGGFSTFRHDHYRYQREHWGHIGYWDCRSFADLMGSCGWVALNARLTPKWHMPCWEGTRVSPLKRLATRLQPELMSFFTSGFYVLGAFRRA